MRLVLKREVILVDADKLLNEHSGFLDPNDRSLLVDKLTLVNDPITDAADLLRKLLSRSNYPRIRDAVNPASPIRRKRGLPTANSIPGQRAAYPLTPAN
jgi:hypothetical protein